jgi:hypothetical protein
MGTQGADYIPHNCCVPGVPTECWGHMGVFPLKWLLNKWEQSLAGQTVLVWTVWVCGHSGAVAFLCFSEPTTKLKGLGNLWNKLPLFWPWPVREQWLFFIVRRSSAGTFPSPSPDPQQPGKNLFHGGKTVPRENVNLMAGPLKAPKLNLFLTIFLCPVFFF